MSKLHTPSILCVTNLSPLFGAAGSNARRAALLEQNVRSLPLGDDRIPRTSVRDDCPDDDNRRSDP
jgi:hypothetical protein